jgi:hypothetical protein
VDPALRRWLRFVGVVVLILAVGVAVVWRERRVVEAGVVVHSDGEPLRCSGGEVVRSLESADAEFVIPLGTLVPTMRCEVRFFVRNDSGRDVTIASVGLPAFGPEGGSGAVATALSPFIDEVVEPRAAGTGIAWDVHDPLRDGERRGYTITVEFRAGGCTAANGSIRVAGPIVVIDRWTMSIALDPATVPIGFLGTDATACPG